MMVSIVVPVYNEEENINNLYKKITDALDNKAYLFEMIFINDGSTDVSGKILLEISRMDNRFKVIEFKRNYGQTAAMMAGFDFAKGDIVIPIDGDLQNDPEDIPRLIDKINEGYDVCSGWRQNRKDSFFLKKFPSWFANKLISMISGVKLHDYGCTLKAYRRECIEGMKLYGEMHRFIPIYASWQGARITEIPVVHHCRSTGRSKYGLERIFKVILDLIVVMFLSTLYSKPIYIFGGFGIASITISFFSFFLMIYYKFWGGKTFIETPLPQLAVLFFLVGFISMLMGFMAEIIMRTYYESQGKPSYNIRHLHNLEKK